MRHVNCASPLSKKQQVNSQEATALIESKKAYDVLESHFKQKAANEIRTLMLCMKVIEGESAHDYERRLTEIITNYGNGVKQ